MAAEFEGDPYSPEKAFAAGGDPAEVAKYVEAMSQGLGPGVSENWEKGRAIESLIARHSKLDTVLGGVRKLQLKNESTETGGEVTQDYDIGRQIFPLVQRELALDYSLAELEEDEIKLPLDEDTKRAFQEMLEKDKNFTGEVNLDLYGLAESGGFGIRKVDVSVPVPHTFKIAKDKKVDIDFINKTREVIYYGADVERQERSDKFRSMVEEVLVRNLLHKNWGRYNFYREALAKLVEIYFGPVPTVAGIHRLLNLPEREGVTLETKAGGELNHFGDKIEMGMRLYYINALSQKPHLFNKLMETPGWDLVFPEKEGFDRAALIKEWIGEPEPDKWTPEGYEDPGMPHRFESDLGTTRSRETLDNENGIYQYVVKSGEEDRLLTEEEKRKKEKGDWDEEKDGEIIKKYVEDLDFRGKLTRRNIFAKSTFESKKLEESIREFLGGGEGASKKDKAAALAAQKLAFKLFKLWLIADNWGYEVYKKDGMEAALGLFQNKELEMENGPAASDWGKLTYPSLYNLKNKRQAEDEEGDFSDEELARDLGPEGSFGKIPRFCTDFLRLLSTKVEVEIDGEPTVQELSFQEQWWGYPVDEKNNWPRIEASRLGELPWKEVKLKKLSEKEAEILEMPVRGMHDESLVGQYLTTFMAGRAELGSYPITLMTNLQGLKPLEDPAFWQKFYKALDVGVKKGVAVNGIFRGESPEEVKKKRRAHIQAIINGFWKGVASTEDYNNAIKDVIPIPGTGGAETIKRADYIIAIAKKAGVTLKPLPPTHRALKT